MDVLLKLNLQYFADEPIDEMDGWDDEEASDTPDEDFDNIGVDEADEDETDVEEETTDEEDKPADEIEETDEPEEESKKDEATDEKSEETIVLKYNHEEKDYTVSEVKELAQKGMNYDKKVEELTNLQNSPELEFVRQQAKENDMTVAEYIQATHDYQKQTEVDKLVEQGTPEDIAKELVDKRYFDKQSKLDKEKAEKEQLSKDTETKDLNEFLETFPDVKVDDIPDEVFNVAKEKSISLTDAMYRIQNQNMEKQIKALKQKMENKTKAPLNKGVAEHGAKAVEKIDPDLDGWDDVDY